MKNRIKQLLTTIVCILLVIHVQAQQQIREGKLTIDGNTYEITRSSSGPYYLVWNMDRSELRPNREMVNGIPLELANTKMTNKNELMEVVCEALGAEKRAQLSTQKEKISGWIYYRGDGSVINIVFKVIDHTKLTLNDLFKIEETFKTRFKANLESVGNLHQHLYHISFNYEWNFDQ